MKKPVFSVFMAGVICFVMCSGSASAAVTGTSFFGTNGSATDPSGASPAIAMSSQSQPPPGVPPITTLPPAPPDARLPVTISAPESVTPDLSFDSCVVTATSLTTKPGGASGEAYGTGKLKCVAPVLTDELWVALESYWTSDKSWHVESTGDITFGTTNQTIYADDSFPCNYKAARDWATVATAYGFSASQSAGGTNIGYQTLSCVG